MSTPTRRCISDVDGSLITDKLWGIYYKPDFHFGGVQGGAMPFKVQDRAGQGGDRSLRPGEPGLHRRRRFRPYVGARRWPSARSASKAQMPKYKKEPSGGIGCFTADIFPVFDRFCENVYVIADSNHGYKMIGVGKLVADDICGNESDLLRAVPLLALRRRQAASDIATARSPGADEPRHYATERRGNFATRVNCAGASVSSPINRSASTLQGARRREQRRYECRTERGPR